MHAEDPDRKKDRLEKFYVRVPANGAALSAELIRPKNEPGIIVLAGKSGSLYNRSIAESLTKRDLATLLPDMNSSDGLPFLADHLGHIVTWAKWNIETADLPLGILALGEAAEAALVATARKPELVKAVVLCGGKLDQVMDFLPLIRAPVLLVAAGRDSRCMKSNQRALSSLNSDSALNVVSNATQSFQEPGAMEESMQLAALWFLRHLGGN